MKASKKKKGAKPSVKSKAKAKVKGKLHPRNRHIGRYDFDALTLVCPELKEFIRPNNFGDVSIDFANPFAVKWLNTALLKSFYELENWEIPEGFLCPPIPGRADYIHQIADLLAASNDGIIPSSKNIKGLDIGVGANCVYPIIGNYEYKWSFIGSDIDDVSIDAARKNVSRNPSLTNAIEIRKQNAAHQCFLGVLQKGEYVDFTMCNPPFHGSRAEAQAATLRKLNNLNLNMTASVKLNFGGKSNELWTEGGEKRFILNMIAQSKQYASSCLWFTTLVSKQTNLPVIYKALSQVDAAEVKTLSMGQGNKISRVVAWTFLSPELKEQWKINRLQK